MTRVRLPRRGAVTVEAALVLPVALFLIIGLLIGAMGVFRYQQVSWLAREGARYASVRGTDYAKETGKPAATPQDVFDNAIKPNAAAMDMSKLGSSVTWDKTNSAATVSSSYSVPRGNTVSVTVTYTWLP